jgi:iron complex outermembrane receptor protein
MSREMMLAMGAAVAALGMGLAPARAGAQQIEQLERVEITGSAIKRIDAESAVPVTTLRMDDLRREGITSVEQVLQRLSVNQSSLTTSQVIGVGTGGASFADLRGIGENKTLVLLNGRRLANNAVDSSAPDLNMIPFAAIERIEVLRDGASALYGTDAIGGVINFITRSGESGLELTLDATLPEHSGGKGRGLGAGFGAGELQRDGYSFVGSVEYRKTDRINSQQRGFADTGFRPGRGFDRTSSITTPANYSQSQPGGDFSANPSFPGCAPVGEGGSIDTGSGQPLCRYDPTPFVDLVPEVERASLFGKAAFRLPASTVASVEYFLTRNVVRTVVSPGTAGGLTMDSSSPFFPGNGITPAPSEFTIDPSLPIDLNWRTAAAGGRAQSNDNRSQRLVFELEGSAAGWDWRTGASYNESRLSDPLAGGWTRDAAIAQGVADGILNPFGDQTAEGAAYLAAAELRGDLRRARGRVAAVDARAGRELGDWLGSGKQAAMALGAEYRKESFVDDINAPVVSQSFGTGFDPEADARGKRNVAALYGELSVPVHSTLEATVAVRHDRYSDFGSTTNPRIALRFQPTPAFLTRATYSTGFRAPSLYELYSPRFLSFSLGTYDDPLLCPGGVPAPGADPAVACGQQFLAQLGGNPDLEPEKARNFTLGFVYEPSRNFQAGLDFWFIRLRNSIGEFPEAAIFADPARYAGRIRRGADGTLDPFAEDPGFFIAAQDNLGEIRTSGIDLSLSWRRPLPGLGAFVLGFNASYITRYDYQNEPGGEFTNNVGRYGDVRPVLRWKHAASAVFEATGGWSVGLANRHQSGYDDENFVEPEYTHRVGAYSVWDVFAGWSPTARLTLGAGIRNLLDTDPPFSNQGSTFQSGYDPRFTDPTGRALFLRLGLRFD